MKSLFLTALLAMTAVAAEPNVPYPGKLPAAAELATAPTPLSVSTSAGTFHANTPQQLPKEAGITVTCRVEPAENAHYVRRTYTLTATQDTTLTGFTPIQLEGGSYMVPGEVPGTPLVDTKAHRFHGIELPVAQVAVQDGKGSVGLECSLPLAKGQSVSFTTVEGTYPEGQLRRAFLAYLERERAVPYHQVVQYNCWYEHGLNPTEEKLLNTIDAYGRELVQKRGVKVDSFVLDDGWDDYGADLWQPHPQKFPNGFAKVTKAAQDIGAHFGIWISPLGGYSGQAERIQHARRMGLIPQDAQGLDLSYPGYGDWYLNRCRDLMQKDGCNFFKWDRAGDGVSPHFMALLGISRELRKVDPQLFLSTTVGTWPSPFWLMYVDCTWRTGSADVAWHGKGNNRERYMTYRDMSCYRVIVKRAPLYPLNSLMHHGLVLGTEFQGAHTSDARPDGADPTIAAAELGGACESAKDLSFPVNNNMRSDARMLCASGANQQELYLTPGMMNDAAWDDVAAALKWSHKWAPVLADAHWVGGDPGEGRVYGYAAWRADRGATLALRNPDDQPQEIELTAAAVFEPTAKGDIPLRAAYADQRVKELTIPAEGSVRVRLEPFEVLVFDADFAAAH